MCIANAYSSPWWPGFLEVKNIKQLVDVRQTTISLPNHFQIGPVVLDCLWFPYLYMLTQKPGSQVFWGIKKTPKTLVDIQQRTIFQPLYFTLDQ